MFLYCLNSERLVFADAPCIWSRGWRRRATDAFFGAALRFGDATAGRRATTVLMDSLFPCNVLRRPESWKSRLEAWSAAAGHMVESKVWNSISVFLSGRVLGKLSTTRSKLSWWRISCLMANSRWSARLQRLLADRQINWFYRLQRQLTCRQYSASCT